MSLYANAAEVLPPELYEEVRNHWNGGIPAQSTIKTVTVTLAGQGTLTMKALQASRLEVIDYVTDGEYSSGNNRGNSTVPSSLSSATYTVGSDAVIGTGAVIAIKDGDLTVREYTAAVSGDVNGDGKATSMDARLVVLSTVQSDLLTSVQLLAADMDGNGKANTADVRAILLSLTV